MAQPATSDRKHYEVLRKLATGGMAEIYLARATGLGGFEKYVVLKRILPHFASDERFISMFLDEARVSALLQHQNIAQVHDIGQTDGTYFFTMEYLHGVDLRQLLNTLFEQSRGLPLANALTIIAGATSGLHYAHEKLGPTGQPLGIVHRDVSLSNVVVTYDGGVKLVDFGVARAAQRDTKTRTGSLKGKVGYMSPEQCRGRPIDRRSDIFSLGVVLFELTTGYRPFGDADDQNDYSTMFQIVEDPPRIPTELDPRYPKELEEIVLRTLEKNPDDRYSTARELLIDLESFASRNRLPMSTASLADFMEGLYGRPAEPWHDLGLHTGDSAVRAEGKVGSQSGMPIKRTISFADIAPRPVSTGSQSGADAPTMLARSASGLEAVKTSPPTMAASGLRSSQAMASPYSPPSSPFGVTPAPHLAPGQELSPAGGGMAASATASAVTGQRTTARSGSSLRIVLAVVLTLTGVAGGLAIAWQMSKLSNDGDAPSQAAPAPAPTPASTPTPAAGADQPAADDSPTGTAVQSATAKSADPIDVDKATAGDGDGDATNGASTDDIDFEVDDDANAAAEDGEAGSTRDQVADTASKHETSGDSERHHASNRKNTDSDRDQRQVRRHRHGSRDDSKADTTPDKQTAADKIDREW